MVQNVCESAQRTHRGGARVKLTLSRFHSVCLCARSDMDPSRRSEGDWQGLVSEVRPSTGEQAGGCCHGQTRLTDAVWIRLRKPETRFGSCQSAGIRIRKWFFLVSAETRVNQHAPQCCRCADLTLLVCVVIISVCVFTSAVSLLSLQNPVAQI